VEQLEPENRPWHLGATLLLSAGIFLVFVLVQSAVGVAFLVSAALRTPSFDPLHYALSLPANGDLLTLATLLSTPLCLAAIYAAIRTRRGMPWQDYLALRPVPGKTLMLWMGGAVAAAAGSDALTLLLDRSVVPEFITQAYATSTFPPLMWLAFVLAAPAFEEAFFRGFLFRGIECSVLGPKGAVAVTAIAFGFVHAQYDLYGVLTALGLGIFLGFARWKTGSLRVSFACHALLNLIATMEAALLG